MADDVRAVPRPASPPSSAPFDLVFADPPYDTTDDEVVTDLLAALGAPGWLAPDALVAVERPVRHPVGRRRRAGEAAGSGRSAIR